MTDQQPKAGAGAPIVDDEDDQEFPEDPRLRITRRLVNLLLVVMAAGILVVVIAMLLKLKQVDHRPVAGLGEGERITAVEATRERVSLTIEDVEGRQRVVILDGRTFRPIAEIADR